jgi:CPA2 family monovalent cation:H+ antiporter-2
MLVSPFLIAAGPSLMLRLFGAGRLAPAEGAEATLRDHVVVVGYGLNGQNLARVLRETGIPYRILDLDAEVAHRGASAGEPITFGDATRRSILQHVHVSLAAVVVVAISDPVATRRVVSLVRQLNRRCAVIVRTRFVSEIEELYGLGADEVIPEEFETSVEIFARVLERMHIPRNVIELQVDLIRGERYAMLRGLALTRRALEDLSAILEASTVQTYLLVAGSPAAGRSLRDLDLRGRSGVTVIAVVRGGESHTNPDAGFVFAESDVLVMLGSHAELAAAARLLEPHPGPSTTA